MTSQPPDVVSAIYSNSSDPKVQESMIFGSGLESGWNDTAQNASGATGPFQILLSAHPNVTAAQAQDPNYATKYMLPAYRKAVGKVSSGLWQTNPELAAEQAAILAEAPGGSFPQSQVGPYGSENTSAVNATWKEAQKWLATGDYGNPFRKVSGLVPQRIDQGVDYGGTGPVYALGSGTITDVQANDPGWFGGYIQEKLDSGPYAGMYNYVAEGVTPSVRTGQHVDRNTVIGNMAGSIETGWAAGPPNGQVSAANVAGEWNGTQSTGYGVSYSNTLHALGAPAGKVVKPVQGGGPGPINAQTTSANTTGSTGLVGGALSQLVSGIIPKNAGDLLERAALVIFGALLVLVGILVMAAPGAYGLASGGLGTAARTSRQIRSIRGPQTREGAGLPSPEEKERRTQIAERNISVGERRVAIQEAKERRLSLNVPKEPEASEDVE